jgi:hypothetical protein
MELTVRGRDRFLSGQNRYGVELERFQVGHVNPRPTGVAGHVRVEASDWVDRETTRLLGFVTRCPLSTADELFGEFGGDRIAFQRRLNEMLKLGLIHKTGKGVKGNPYRYAPCKFNRYSAA